MLLSTISFATKHTVLVGNYYFNPSNIPAVQVGDTIRWEWVQGNHTTTSTSVPLGAVGWDSPITSSNQVYEYLVNTPGTYDYHCTLHSGIQTGSFTATGFIPTLTVNPLNQNVTHEDGTTTFDVTSNVNWTANSDATWCTVTLSGSGTGILTATYTENTTTFVRIANITVQAQNGPTQVVTVTQDRSSLGIEQMYSDVFQVYPNPTSGICNVELPPSINPAIQLAVMDLSGKTVMTKVLSGGSQYRMDITMLHDGIYFFRFRDGEKTTSVRIVKSR